MLPLDAFDALISKSHNLDVAPKFPLPVIQSCAFNRMLTFLKFGPF
jgi:hypothetical protein